MNNKKEMLNILTHEEFDFDLEEVEYAADIIDQVFQMEGLNTYQNAEIMDVILYFLVYRQVYGEF